MELMAGEATVASEARPSFLARNSFLLRRLHSLSGLVPVGAYMVVHLLTNASVLNGVASFQKNVDMIHSLGRALPVVEWVFIFIPLIFHAGYGFVRIYDSQANAAEYPYPKNIRYTLQRISGMVAFVYILFHVAQLHHLGFGQFDAEHATSSAARAIGSGFWMQAWYVVGVLACVYHLANGIWTSGITWGIWTSPAAQRRADYVCWGFGFLVAVIGMSALFGFGTVDVEKARAQEDRMQKARIEQAGEIEEAEAPAAEATKAP
jgi:succinate dehydrogenase / fumarate reductase cytochrome b subunit